MTSRYKFTLYNNWKRKGTIELLTINWCHNVKYYGITILNFELMYAETWEKNT